VALNGSALINDTWNTTFSPFTDLFTDLTGFGGMFYLIILCFITAALFVKVRDITVVGMFMLVSGIFLSAGNIFAGAEAMAGVFVIFAILGLIIVIKDNLKRG